MHFNIFISTLTSHRIQIQVLVALVAAQLFYVVVVAV